jgi:hypothetical protein
MNRKVGEYYYAINGNSYEIFQVEKPVNGVHSARNTHETFTDPEVARERVYKLNGWKWKH